MSCFRWKLTAHLGIMPWLIWVPLSIRISPKRIYMSNTILFCLFPAQDISTLGKECLPLCYVFITFCIPSADPGGRGNCLLLQVSESSWKQSVFSNTISKDELTSPNAVHSPQCRIPKNPNMICFCVSHSFERVHSWNKMQAAEFGSVSSGWLFKRSPRKYDNGGDGTETKRNGTSATFFVQDNWMRNKWGNKLGQQRLREINAFARRRRSGNDINCFFPRELRRKPI